MLKYANIEHAGPAYTSNVLHEVSDARSMLSNADHEIGKIRKGSVLDRNYAAASP